MKLGLTTFAAALLCSAAAFASSDNVFLDKEWLKESTVEAVDKALADGHDIKQRNHKAYAPLALALRYGASPDVIVHMVKNGSDVNRGSHGGRPSVFWASRYRDVAMIKMLIELGADPTLLDDSKRSALGYAGFGQKDPEVFKFLVNELGMDVNGVDTSGRTPALAAAGWNPNLEVFKTLVEMGSDPMAKTDDGHDVFLLSAARNKSLDVVKYMMGISADPHAVDEDGNGAMILAAQRGSLEKLQWLQDQGFKLSDSNNAGSTPLIRAAYRNKADVIRWLLDQGQDVSAVKSGGETPLLQAAIRNNAEVTQMLIDAGANVNRANKRGDTPIIIAAGRDRDGTAELIAVLLKAGADVNAAAKNGTTALIEAARAGKKGEDLAMLLDAGANVNARDKDGYSALMYAALRATDASAIDVLLAAGADRGFKDVFDDTAAIIVKDNAALAGTDVEAKLAP